MGYSLFPDQPTSPERLRFGKRQKDSPRMTRNYTDKNLRAAWVFHFEIRHRKNVPPDSLFDILIRDDPLHPWSKSLFLGAFSKGR